VALAAPYDGWPGMALKQIMGQMDLFQNFQEWILRIYILVENYVLSLRYVLHPFIH
jgi:hypothetical protein